MAKKYEYFFESYVCIVMEPTDVKMFKDHKESIENINNTIHEMAEKGFRIHTMSANPLKGEVFNEVYILFERELDP